MGYVDAPYKTKEWLEEQYISKGRGAQEIADECGINLRTLREWISTFELNDKQDVRSKLPADEIIDLYTHQGLATDEIGKKYNTTGNTVAALLKDCGVDMIPRSELSKRWLHEKCGIEHLRDVFGDEQRRIECSCRQTGIDPSEFVSFATTEAHLIRKSSEYQEWRTKVFQRDNYTCQKCLRRGGDLEAHHIENFSSCPELRTEVDNGITLCVKCHSAKYKDSFHGKYGEKDNTRAQLDEFLLA